MISLSKKKEWEEPCNQLIIDLNAIQSNYQYLKSKLSDDCVFYAVLKTDAYGHGIIEVSNALARVGCQHFAVDTPHEGIQLRKQGFAGEILLLNPIPGWMAETAVYHDLSVSVIHPSILDSLEKAAQNLEKKVKIHVAVNVGLNRLGISSSGLMEILDKISSNQSLKFEGLYGQARDHTSAKQSYEQLCSLYRKLKSTGVVPKHLHFPNSTTFLAHPETAITGVRLGILLYGVLPPEQYANNMREVPIIPAMSLHSRVIQMREVPKGSEIGYRAGQNTEHDLIIATIPIGYAQGLDRRLSSSSSVLIKGQRAPFIGAISMNNSMVDVTDIPDVKIGDRVTIIGRQVDSEININELAAKSGTISAELMVRFGQGIARQYISDENDSNNIVILSPKETQNIQITHIQTEKELPDWITVWELIGFLKNGVST